jgi:LacI family transcriptional regulator
VEINFYDPTSSQDFEKACQDSMELNPDGVLLGALFLKESQSYLAELEARKIPFNLINIPIEGANFETFVGQDLVQSGRTAAHLFDVFLPERKTILIVHIAEDFENAFHMQQKEKGFRTYYSQKSCVNISTLNIKAEEGVSINQQLLGKRTGDIHGIFVTTSKAHLIAEVGTNIPIIGYDLLKENISHLNSGGIKFLIYQNPKLQAYQGLSLLADHLLKGERAPNKKYLPIEIISSENVSSYQV